MFMDMERLFVIVCALGAASVRSEKIQQSVDADYYNQNNIDSNYLHQGIENDRINEVPINRVYDRENERKAEYEVYKLLSNASGPVDMVKLNSLSDHLISQANVTEEARRAVRQVKKQRPGFFWTIFRVAFETVSDTTSTIQEIVRVINKAINPPPTTTVKAPLTATGSSNGTTTTTEAPFMLTAEGVLTTIRRNLKGLIKLFNIEWKDAVDGSKISAREFKKDLGKSIAPFLADNPDAY